MDKSLNEIKEHLKCYVKDIVFENETIDEFSSYFNFNIDNFSFKIVVDHSFFDSIEVYIKHDKIYFKEMFFLLYEDLDDLFDVILSTMKKVKNEHLLFISDIEHLLNE